MRQGLKLPVTFRTLEGDEEETQGSGCAIGGMGRQTDDYFKGKRVVLSRLPVHLHHLSQVSNSVLKKTMTKSYWVLMKLI